MDSVPYVLSLMTDLECQGSGVDIMFGQPPVYTVDMSIVGDGICVGEQQAVIILETVGGTAPFLFDIYADGTIYAANSPNVNHVVPIGPMYTVVSKDAMGCEAVDTLDLPTPVAVTFTVENATCFADTLASAIIMAEGTPGRMFQAKWDEFEGDIVVKSDTSEWFSDKIRLDQVFTYDDTNVDDVHFEITVVDDQGCTAGIDTITFDKVDGPLQVVNVESTPDTECETEFSFEIAGGTAPYAVWVDTMIVADSIGFFERIDINLGAGSHKVYVVDAHECALEYDFDIEYSTSRMDTVEIYEGDTAHYMDEMAMVDTMLVGGDYEFIYAVDSGCPAQLLVSVIEMPRVPVALDSVSPMDTIADNKPVFVLTFMDDVMLNGMGYITVTAMGDSVPTLEIEITADMFSDNTITIDYDGSIEGHLDTLTTYVVQVDSGVVMGGGTVWDGIADDSTWTFTTGMDDVTTDNPFVVDDIEFKVYPNPFNDMIRIDNYDKLTRVVISNIAGQRVVDIEYPNYEIRTGNLVSGVYIVSMFTDEGLAKSERMIKR
jgi:hypothetical protein